MKTVKEELAGRIGRVLGIEVTAEDIEAPGHEYGDFAYPAMKAASEPDKGPREIAAHLEEELSDGEFIDDIEVAGPGYVNFYLDRESYSDIVLDSLSSDKMGVEQREGEMLVEFSSPNIAKPMHVGHLRNNVLGDALQRMMRFAGYDVTSENYVGDLGTQFGKVIYAHLNLESDIDFEEEPMEYMYDLYVRFHEEAKQDDSIEEEAREWAKKIEEGDEEAVELWEMFRAASLEHHREEYRRLGISFDRITGESTVKDGARALVEDWLDEGRLERDDDGSVFMEFEDEDLPGVVLLKQDGSTLYITRDLYNLKKRNQEGFDHNLYVVASEQELNFRQLFAAAEKLGLETEGSEHVSYGLLSLPEGSMSSREGRITREADLFDRAVERARAKAAEKIEREVENAEPIGIGAVKYANLAVSRKKNIQFDWDRALSFEGDSGPYLQYSNTRAKSILEKAGESGEMTGEPGDSEYRLLKKLAEFPEKVEAAVNQREPAKVANYLSSLAEEFNSFYHECPVLDSEGATKARRLKLVEAFVDITDTGLELLGIEPLEEM